MNLVNANLRMMAQRILTLLFIASLAGQNVSAQLVDPIPTPIADGDITVRIVDWIQVPDSDGLKAKVNLAYHSRDNSGRLFVNDQRGLLYVIENDNISLYLDLYAQLDNEFAQSSFGSGFHSFTFHPEFSTNGKLYTVHMEPTNSGTPDLEQGDGGSVQIHSIISEWTAVNPVSNSFSGTRREVVRIEQPRYNHTIQEIGFNPNATPADADYGLLYVGQGDGQVVTVPRAQNLSSVHGSIMRIDPLGNNSENGRYGIPPDNPFANDGDPNTRAEIWAYGFRNPHRFSWDTGGDGIMLVGDIGEKNLEEINLVQAGANYGWPPREGTFRFDSATPGDVFPLPSNDGDNDYYYPVAQYDHDEGFAIVAGFVYRGTQIPELQGQYLFGDLFNGRIFYVPVSELVQGQQATIKKLQLVNSNDQSVNMRNVTGEFRVDLRFGLTEDNEIVILSKADGKVRRLESLNAPVVDSDNDGIADDVDNCLNLDNTDQQNTDGDQFGNRCDPDLNNDNIVNFLDVALFSDAFNSTSANEDFNGDGVVNFIDFSILRDFYLLPPGP